MSYNREPSEGRFEHELLRHPRERMGKKGGQFRRKEALSDLVTTRGNVKRQESQHVSQPARFQQDIIKQL